MLLKKFCQVSIYAFVLSLFLGQVPVQGQDSPSQIGINERLAILAADCGVTPAYPAEWQAQTAGDVIRLYEYLGVIYTACQEVAYTIWRLDGSPEDYTPLAYFRLHFDQAGLQIDRTFNLGSYEGNTAPRYANGEVIGYMIQLSPMGMAQPFTFAHEIGHVVDALLLDKPHQQHMLELGGVVGSVGWIPGRGYESNELLFPRAVAGPNEDFADTFGQMMIGNLSPLNSTAPRWAFMMRHTREWLRLLREDKPDV